MKRPLVRPLPRVSFETAVASLSSEPGFFALDDSRNPRRKSSVVAFRPSSSISFSGAFVTVDGRTAIDTPRTALASFLARASAFPRDPYLPFSGGAIGYVGFEGIRALSGFSPAEGFSRFPQGFFGIYRAALVFNRTEGTASIVATGDDAADMADDIEGRLEEASKAPLPSYAVPAAAAAGEDEKPRFRPCDEEFSRIAEDARGWLRSEAISRIHLTRQILFPSFAGSVLSSFLGEERPGLVRVIFSHEGAAALLASQESVESGIERKADRVAAFLSSLPSAEAAGLPFERAMSFVANHEKAHRCFHGGAFGIFDAAGFSFFRISSSLSDSDGVLAKTAGLDMTADCDPSAVKAKLDEMLLSS